MITRTNLAEQLRDYQIRSANHWASLSFFSSTSNVSSRAEVVKAALWLSVFVILTASAFVSLYFGYIWPSVFLSSQAVVLFFCLRYMRLNKLSKRRQRRLLP
ncbi:hypothetical protein O6H91_01G042500 [Diphasiastrum complanatum]|uniref:Uncharacterized protein n=1 Tax=Diphasiastrum complanatum TaxID=34168 RepID=A0ACC2EQ92_DIPCM|nr:hypothetical protein O6H91_01G042500 [Diphasiastrum complanatum]